MTSLGVAQGLRSDAQAVEEKRIAAFRLNSMVLSGRSGQVIVERFTAALQDFGDAAWKGLPLRKEDLFASALLMARAMADAWRRLCIPYEQPRFRIFDACHVRGQAVYDRDRILDVARPLIAMQGVCEQCVEQEFTGKLLGPLLSNDLSVSKAAHQLLCDIMCSLRVSSASVERAHLPAEECRPAKARGRAMEVAGVAAHTYRRFVRDEHTALHAKAQEEVLNAAGLTSQQFSALSRGGRFGASSGAGRAPVGMRQPRALSGVDLFRSEQWNRSLAARVGSRAHLAEGRRIREAWSALAPEERGAYQRRAEVENTTRAAARSAGTVAAVDVLGLGASARQGLMRQIAQHARQRLDEHSCWKAGLGLGCPGSAIRPDLVTQEAQEYIEVPLVSRDGPVCERRKIRASPLPSPPSPWPRPHRPFGRPPARPP